MLRRARRHPGGDCCHVGSSKAHHYALLNPNLEMLSAPGYYFCCIKNYLLLDASSCWERSISRSTMMLRKTIISVVAAASVGMLAPNVALARGGGGGGGVCGSAGPGRC